MKTLNRTLSLALVFALVFSLMSFAFAADTTTTTTTTTTPTTTTTTTTPTTTAAAPTAAFTDQASIKHTDAVNSMVALNVINGYEDGSFKPAENVTRGQMCKMICILLNSGAVPTLSTNATPTYTDIKGHWAESYIEYCSKLGIVAGMGDGTFAPNATVTVGQAAKMLLVALGYDAKTEGFTGSDWLLAVNVRANQKGLYKDLTLDSTATLDRDNAAQMISNAAFANEVEYEYKIVTNNGAVSTTASVKDKTKIENNNTVPVTLVMDKYNLTDKIGIFSNETYNASTKQYAITLTGTGAGTYYSTVDFSKFFGMQVRLFAVKDATKNQYNVYGVSAYQSSIVASGMVGLIGEDMLKAMAADATTKQFTSNGKTYYFDSAVAATKVYNFNDTSKANGVPGATVATITVSTALKIKLLGETYEMIDTNNDSKIDTIVVYPYTVAKVSNVSSTTASFYGSYPTPATTTTKTLSDINTYSGMAKGDYVKITAGTNTVDGKDTYEKITTMDMEITHDSTNALNIHKVMLGTTYLADIVGGTGTMKVGFSYTGIAQVNGVIYDATVSKTTVTAKDYALLTWAGKQTGSNQAKLVFSDGTTKTVDTDKNYGNTGDGATNLWNGTDATLVNYKYSSSTNTYALTDAAIGSFDAQDNPSADNNSDVNSKGTDGYAYYNYSSSGSKLCGDTIDDSAVIFAKVVAKNAPSTVVGYKVLTGAQFKTLASTAVYSVSDVYANKNVTTGFYSVTVAYVMINSDASVAAKTYGYVTSVGTTPNADKTTVTELTVWTGKESKTIVCDTLYSGDNAFAQGDIIQFSLGNDGKSYVPEKCDKTLAAITAYDGKNITFDIPAKSKTVTDTDTTIIYVNGKTGDVMTSGAIQPASVTDSSVTNAYVPNAIYVDYDADHDLKVLVVEANSNAFSKSGVIDVQGDVTGTQVTTLLGTYSAVEVMGDVTGTTAVTVPQDKGLFVRGTTAPAVTVSAAEDPAHQAGIFFAYDDVTGDLTNHGTCYLLGTTTKVAANTGTISTKGDITTVTSNAGTINIGADLVITTLAANTGKVVVAAGKTLTVTGNATPENSTPSAALELVFGADSTAKLKITNQSKADYTNTLTTGTATKAVYRTDATTAMTTQIAANTGAGYYAYDAATYSWTVHA